MTQGFTRVYICIYILAGAGHNNHLQGMQVKGAKEAEALIILMNYLDDNLFGLYWKVSMSYKSCVVIEDQRFQADFAYVAIV